MTVQTGSSIVHSSSESWPLPAQPEVLTGELWGHHAGHSNIVRELRLIPLHSTVLLHITVCTVLYICYYFQWAVGAWREFRLIPLHSTVLLDIMYSIYMLLISMISRGMEGYGTSVRFSKTVTLLPIRFICISSLPTCRQVWPAEVANYKNNAYFFVKPCKPTSFYFKKQSAKKLFEIISFLNILGSQKGKQLPFRDFTSSLSFKRFKKAFSHDAAFKF